jgi:hypothetical protein
MERRRNLLECIGPGGTSLAELARVACIPSVDVAASLQGLRQSGLVETADGLWKRCTFRDRQDVIVVVDLGNVHDCLQKLAPLAEAGELQVRAYADLQYNGYGVNPPFESPGCVVFRAATPHKNAADTKIIWDISRLCSLALQPLRILVVTKDNGFRHLRELAEESGHSLTFAQDWPSLRSLLLPPTVLSSMPPNA